MYNATLWSYKMASDLAKYCHGAIATCKFNAFAICLVESITDFFIVKIMLHDIFAIAFCAIAENIFCLKLRIGVLQNCINQKSTSIVITSY